MFIQVVNTDTVPLSEKDGDTANINEFNSTISNVRLHHSPLQHGGGKD